MSIAPPRSNDPSESLVALDDWTGEGKRVTDEVVLANLRHVIEKESPVIIEHRFYRGSQSPRWFVCNDFEELEEYLRSHTSPGDDVWYWHFMNCCRDDNALGNGKIPDSQGRVPRRGAY